MPKSSKKAADRRPRVRRGNRDDQQALKRALIDAALALFVEGGVEAVKMRAVAERVGRSPMAAYRYFADKDELLSGLWEFVLEAVHERMAAALDGPPTARARQAAVIDAYLAHWEALPGHYQLVYASQGSARAAPVAGAAPSAVYGRLLALTERVTREFAAELGVGAEHIKLASDVRFAMQLGYLNGLLMNRRYPWGERAVLRAVYIDQIVATVERCLRHGAASAATH